MAQITDAEYQRMRNQMEAKFAYTSEIAFLCKYVDATATPAVDLTEWEETGYIADFRPIGEGDIEKIGVAPSAYVFSQGAICRLPMRYYTNPSSFVAKQAPILAAMGKNFHINIVRSGSPFLENGVISCYAIRLKNYLNIEPQTFTDINWSLVGEPQIEADCVMLQLHGDETLSVYDWMKADHIPLPKHGRLVNRGGSFVVEFNNTGVKR